MSFHITLPDIGITDYFSIKFFLTYLLISLKLFKDLSLISEPFFSHFRGVISELGCKDTDFFITCKFFHTFFAKKLHFFLQQRMWPRPSESSFR